MPTPDVETMTTAEAREYLGLGSDRAARVQLARWGIAAVGRDLDTGAKLWPAGEVRDAAANRPGCGYWATKRQEAVEDSGQG